MNNHVKISVILPVYNVEPYIGRCIECLRTQLLDGLEFVFVDDCGTDGSMAAVEAWAAQDPRVRILRNGKNIGAGPSRNRGIEAARGDYLSFVDPDDYIAPDFYLLLYAAATQGGGHDIAKGRCRWVDAESGEIGAAVNAQNDRIRRGLLMRKPLYWLLTYEHWTCLWRRSLFDDPEVRYGTSVTNQDTTFQLRACYQTNDIVFENDAIYYYVQLRNSATHQSAVKRAYGDLDALGEKFDFLLSKGFDKHAAKYFQTHARLYFQRLQTALDNGLVSRDNIPSIMDSFAEMLARVPNARAIAKGIRSVCR